MTLERFLNSKTKSYSLLTLSALIYTFALQAFVSIVGTFPTGVAAFATLIIYIAPNWHTFFSVIYLILNIPLAIFSIFFNKRKFTIRTIYWLIMQTLFGLLFVFLPLRDFIVETLWHFEDHDALIQAVWPLIILPMLGGIFGGLAMGLAWKGGGSTAGIDIISYYLSTKRQLAIGGLTRVAGLIIVTFSFTVGVAVDEAMRDIAFMTLLGTLTFVFVSSAMIDWVYPRYSKVDIVAYIKNPEEFKKGLVMHDYPHSYNIIAVETGVADSNMYMFTTTCLRLEQKQVTRTLHKINPQAWIKVSRVSQVIGRFNTAFVDN